MSEINTTKVTEKMVVSCRNVIGGCGSTSQTTRAALAATVGISVTALLLGIGIGGAAQPDPTATAEYATLEDILADTEKRAAQAEEQLETAQQDAADAQTQYDRLAAEVKDLEARQADVDAREAAVSAAEQGAEANSITDGIWVVGVDNDARRYETVHARHGGSGLAQQNLVTADTLLAHAADPSVAKIFTFDPV
jgi:hypothetical protein